MCGGEATQAWWRAARAAKIRVLFFFACQDMPAPWDTAAAAAAAAAASLHPAPLLSQTPQVPNKAMQAAVLELRKVTFDNTQLLA